ncbi:MAG: hypothetical protein ABI444_06440 [Candidatus Kapaibacterium sp.]|jgi:hypothetical protein
MKYLIYTLLASLSLILGGSLSSCGFSRVTLGSDRVTANAIHDASTERPATIGLMNGDTLLGYNINFRKDSTWWLRASDAKLDCLPTSQIRFVEISTPKTISVAVLGVLQGLLFGSLVGVAVAPEKLFWFLPTLDLSALPYFAVTGATLGGVVGGMIGGHHTTRFEQFPKAPEPFKP